ncbi:MAG: hypothetical protein RSB36_01870 [Hydrogenoanaerobacterium sp.]
MNGFAYDFYKDIPSFLCSTVQSHKGQLVFEKLAGSCMVCISGRFKALLREAIKEM